MSERDWLAEAFAAHRARLQVIAHRLLGSASEADDAVQEAWLRLSRSDAEAVQNLGGWLTTVVGRICLDMLRARTARREEPLDTHASELADMPADEDDPEQEAVLADSVGLALLVVLDSLTPAERLAFVLHDMFAVPFEEIGQILHRTPAAAKMIASRARRKVQAADPPSDDPDPARQRSVVAAFLAASRKGDFEALLAMLDPDVVWRADAAAISAGAVPHLRGAVAVAGHSAGRHGLRPVLVNGAAAGAAWAPGGRPRVVFTFAIRRDQIVAIDVVADPERLSQLNVTVLRNTHEFNS